jgi:protein phosphatase
MKGRVSVGVVCSIGVGPGRGGRPTNQDNYLVCRDGQARWRDGDREQVTSFPDGIGVLLAVADGMGGHEDGELASGSAVQALARLWTRRPGREPDVALQHFLLDAHRVIRERVAVAGEVKMGSTLTAAWMVDRRVWWAHVGDSRLYHWRRGRITRITRDQTREEFARRDMRTIPPHPRYLAQNFIYGSRGLGNDAGLRIDRGIDTGSFTMMEEDRLVLCSDGLHGWLEDAQIGDAVRHVPDPAACAVTLTERALAHRSDDNVTALVLKVESLAPGAQKEDTLIPV